MKENNIRFVFFGGEPLGVTVLEELEIAGLLPSLIVCNPDRPVGRKRELTPPPVKVWAEEHDIPVWQPLDFNNQAAAIEQLTGYDLFVVVAYNRILPKWLIELPKHQTLNLHPSLLPKLRGPSPIRTAILHNERDAIGVSVIVLDEKMDHGPLLTQKSMTIAHEHWPIVGEALDDALGHQGGALLADTILKWVAGEITPREQNHDAATYTKMLTRAGGELALDPHHLPTGDVAQEMYTKIQAFSGWPETYFMHDGKRVKIKKAELTKEGQLRLLRVVPEGRPELDFTDYISRSS